jgi:hypothetical protein
LPEGHPHRAVAACYLAAALHALDRDADARLLVDGCARLESYGLVERSTRDRAKQLIERLRSP